MGFEKNVLVGHQPEGSDLMTLSLFQPFFFHFETYNTLLFFFNLFYVTVPSSFVSVAVIKHSGQKQLIRGKDLGGLYSPVTAHHRRASWRKLNRGFKGRDRRGMLLVQPKISC